MSRRVSGVVAGFATALGLAACGTAINEKSQHISISTDPPGAACRVFRSGVQVADVANTPGAIEVRTSPIDLVVVCDKPGYQTASRINKADIAAATVVSAAMFGGTGWAVDSTTGTANRYDSDVKITLAPIK